VSTAGAHVYKDHVIEFDGVEYSDQVRKSRIVPTTNTQTWKAAVPGGVVVDTDDPTWVWEVEGLQINKAGGLAKAIRDAAGTEVDVVIQEKSGSGEPTASFSIAVQHVPFGGEEGAFMVTEVEFGVVGQPVFGTSA
jgi:hypothetical protein